jgi:O-antigen ligase
VINLKTTAPAATAAWMGITRQEFPPLGVILLGVLVGLLSHVVGGAIAVIGFAWLAFVSLPAALGVWILASPFPFGVVVHGHHLFVSDLMAVIMAATFLYKYREEATPDIAKRVFPEAFRWPLLMLLFFAVVSLAHAISHTQTLVKILEYIEFFVVIVAIAADNGLDFNKWKPALGALFLGAAAISVWGLVQFWLGIGPASFVVGHLHTRAFVPFGQPNQFGGFMAQIFPLGLALYVFGPKDRAKPWLLAALILIALGIFASFSRGAEVAVLVAVLVVILAAYVTRGSKALGALAAWGLVMPAAAILFISKIQTLGRGHVKIHHAYKPVTSVTRFESVTKLFKGVRSFSMHQRILIWKTALKVFKLHKFTGVGLGGFHYYVLHHHIAGVPGVPPHAHDIYLELAADTGIGGVIAIVWYQWRWVSVAYKAVREQFLKLDDWVWAMTLGATGTIVDFGVHNTVDLLIDHGVIVPLLLALGVLSAVVAAARKSGAAA